MLTGGHPSQLSITYTTRRKQSSQGTECADPSNSKSVSFTGRASIAASLVREHDFLGAYLNHMEVVYVHRQEDPRKLT